ncbi:DUF4136 domain-containing protein [Pontibacter sp. JH31]|uniref:DUF4136 domain-containing protein n=1 Tax=Pontibacter aquaedesilientis TaxID=2766980 RepID=A0ABR7XE18_9BACT|nr:DUF4136 domain-containing protein [Pontibacter aquaedesilientis]MBD1396166.1 DUF4136 domain-containing protein [Pontibacter aquaedesilientis]
MRTFTKILRFACVFLLLIPALLSSCVATSGIDQTSSISSPEKSLSTQKTYNWYQAVPVAPAAFENGYSSSLHQHLLKAIEVEFEKKGYSKTSLNPDLLVAYDVSVSVPESKDKPELYGNGFGYSYAYMAGYRYDYGNAQMPGYRMVDLFKEGTLIVDVIDPKSKQLLWRGWTEGAVSNFNAGYGKVEALVKAIIQRLPAASNR